MGERWAPPTRQAKSGITRVEGDTNLIKSTLTLYSALPNKLFLVIEAARHGTDGSPSVSEVVGLGDVEARQDVSYRPALDAGKVMPDIKVMSWG